jgi:hypothetical protein
MYTGLHTSTGYSRQILMKLNFLDIFSKKYSNSKFREHYPLGAELFRGDGRTGRQPDLTKLIVAFHNSVNAPTDQVCCLSNYSSMEVLEFRPI